MNAPAASPAAIEAAPVPSGPINSFARGVAVIVGGLGVLGLIPGITTNYAGMGFFRSEAELFGLFTTSILSASIQILMGLTILAFSGSAKQAHKTVVWVALTYLALGLAGAGVMVNDPNPVHPVNVAGNWLHLALGLVILAGAARTRAKHQDELGVF